MEAYGCPYTKLLSHLNFFIFFVLVCYTSEFSTYSVNIDTGNVFATFTRACIYKVNNLLFLVGLPDGSRIFPIQLTLAYFEVVKMITLLRKYLSTFCCFPLKNVLILTHACSVCNYTSRYFWSCTGSIDMLFFI